MSRTMWLALFYLAGVGAAVTIKVAMPASLVVEPAQGQSNVEPAFALNESAKSDRLELSDSRVETEITLPAPKTMPVETPSLNPQTTKRNELANSDSTPPATKTTPVDTPSPNPEPTKRMARRH